MPYSNGKCAVITGAGSGIGRALAQQLHSEGCELYLSDIDAERLDSTLNSLPNRAVTAQGQILNVADKAAVHAWAEAIASEREHVDIVINNAGVAYIDAVADANYDDFEWLVNINLWGVIYGSKAFLPLLQRAPRGHLVNISSAFGLIAIPTQSAYNTAKFGVRGFTEALRHEMADSSVHVCCVHPGGISTDIARTSRGGDPNTTPDERAALFKKLAPTSAESAAAQIIRAIEKRQKRLLIGRDAKYISLVSRLFPVNYLNFIPGLGNVGREV